MIRGKLFPNRYSLPNGCVLISVAFVVLCSVGCLGVTGVVMVCLKDRFGSRCTDRILHVSGATPELSRETSLRSLLA